MANLASVTIVKPARALVSITRRLTDTSNTVAVTVNKGTAVTAQNTTAPTVTPSPWRAGAWKVGA